jgi:hypothetical protein
MSTVVPYKVFKKRLGESRESVYKTGLEKCLGGDNVIPFPRKRNGRQTPASQLDNTDFYTRIVLDSYYYIESLGDNWEGPEAEFILELIKEGLGMKLESIEQAKAYVERYLLSMVEEIELMALRYQI